MTSAFEMARPSPIISRAELRQTQSVSPLDKATLKVLDVAATLPFPVTTAREQFAHGITVTPNIPDGSSEVMKHLQIMANGPMQQNEMGLRVAMYVLAAKLKSQSGLPGIYTVLEGDIPKEWDLPTALTRGSLSGIVISNHDTRYVITTNNIWRLSSGGRPNEEPMPESITPDALFTEIQSTVKQTSRKEFPFSKAGIDQAGQRLLDSI